MNAKVPRANSIQHAMTIAITFLANVCPVFRDFFAKLTSMSANPILVPIWPTVWTVTIVTSVYVLRDLLEFTARPRWTNVGRRRANMEGHVTIWWTAFGADVLKDGRIQSAALILMTVLLVNYFVGNKLL